MNPVPHGVHDEAPALDIVFTGHCMHEPTDVALTVVEYVPAGQFVHPAPGPVPYFPAPHGVQSVANVAGVTYVEYP